MTFLETDAREVIETFTNQNLRRFYNMLPTMITWECANKDPDYRLSSMQVEKNLRLGTGLCVLGRDIANNFTYLSDNLTRPFPGIVPLCEWKPENMTIAGAENPGAPLIIVTNQTPMISQRLAMDIRRGVISGLSSDLAAIRIASEEIGTLQYLRYANATQLNRQAFISGPSKEAVRDTQEQIQSLSPFVGIVTTDETSTNASNFVEGSITSQSINSVDRMQSFTQQMDSIERNLLTQLGVPTMETSNERRVQAEVEALKSEPQVYAATYQKPREESARLILESEGYEVKPVFTMSWQQPMYPGSSALMGLGQLPMNPVQ